MGASRESARAAAAPYIDKGYRGIDPAALLVGSSAEVAEQIAALAAVGYTDVIVRNISARQEECLATIERLAEVRALLSD